MGEDGTRGGATYEAEAGGADGWSGRRDAKEIGKRTAEGLEGQGDRNDAGTEGSKDSHGCWYGRAHAVAAGDQGRR